MEVVSLITTELDLVFPGEEGKSLFIYGWPNVKAMDADLQALFGK